MLESQIKAKTQQWLDREDCSVKDLLNYIRQKGKLRESQIEAIETYLFLKIEGQNKPLWELFAEGFFSDGLDLSRLNINQQARDFLATNQAAMALFDFASQKIDGKARLSELEQLITNDPESLDYQSVIKSLFYGVNYPDYLMSLPMGAGKTYLMAAFMYLDLYFADNEPQNKAFAHNFLVLVPSGLKSSIVPSLRTIEHFDPSWVIAEPAASKLKQILKFEVLDESKTGKKSGKARNPNAQKVNQCLPNPFGQVFVVNAEKVILDRLELTTEQRVIESDEDERDRYANELRNLIGKMLNLSILIDEVHHAAKDDIKLRQVVNKWHAGGNITTVLGFSGTPYLSSAEKIPISETISFKSSQITNTVYYYPLTTAIQQFLKKPTVKIGYNLGRSEIIRHGIQDFQKRYEQTIYEKGTIAKLAIYCSNIEVLEEEVYPFLTGELGIPSDEILKYHGGNKTYSLPKENEYEFRSLDLPISKKRYILLVQVGKEGWDCPSLTGVILSQKGDSPKNMVLQTSCRCLRQVDSGASDETALIWLNDYNAKMLNEQLEQEQNTSIAELNNLNKAKSTDTVIRYARLEHLQLPTLDFYQLKVSYQSITQAEILDTPKHIHALNPDDYKTSALVRTSYNLDQLSTAETDIINATGHEPSSYPQWLFEISKESFGQITLNTLQAYDDLLKPIFQTITYTQEGQTFFNDLYDRYTINSQIRLAFSPKRKLETKAEVIPQDASLLIVDKLSPVDKHDKLYPSPEDSQKIIGLDSSGAALNINPNELENTYKIMKDTLMAQGLGNMVQSFDQFRTQFDYSMEVQNKDRSFHYLPYDFKQSRFELDILKEALSLNDLKEKQLEIYFNGERGLTEFVINCFAKDGKFYKNIGKYTTDFLLIQRKDNTIYKALILETKGSGYSNDPAFLKKKHYVETEFLEQNNQKFGYQRFDFLYLEDSADMPTNLTTLSQKINQFFKD